MTLPTLDGRKCAGCSRLVLRRDRSVEPGALCTACRSEDLLVCSCGRTGLPERIALCERSH
ncbi:hypothetical protein [Halomarina oriensis]|uniref:Uncharacterized protein n=1 Tax=Halomarina oriensis TaxID=671145 RepID=A0A6B0GS72_9EURY|nr:hypothetical protein [Halomarina oriensis]MWG36539.1 hypothetical protein [Halomarina oriensis]